MSLSLEVRKFINSEQTGEYVEIILPSELPVEREELRAVHRDNEAAEEAKRQAEYMAEKLDAAIKARDASARALETAYREEKTAGELLAEAKAHEAGLQPNFDAGQSSMVAAKNEYERVKAESSGLCALLANAEEARNKAAAEYSAANSAAASRRAAYNAAKNAAESAVRNENELMAKAEEARSANAEAEIISGRAEDEKALSVQNEKEKNDRFNEINIKSIQLIGERKLLEKQLSDMEKSEAKLIKDLARAKIEHETAAQMRDVIKTRFEAAQGAEKDKEKETAAAKLAAAENKVKDAGEAVQKKEAQCEEAAKAVGEAKSSLNECERKLAENTEELNSARLEHEAAKQRTAKAVESSVAEKAKFAARNAALTALNEQLGKAAAVLSGAKSEQQRASGETAAAEADAARLKSVLDNAEADVKLKKSAADSALAITAAAEKEYVSRKSAFESVNSLKEKAAAETAAANDRHIAAQTLADRLKNELSAAEDEAERLADEAETARADAVMLRESVHTIETKYEKAKIHYMESGKGEPFILIHSTGQSLYTFRKLFFKLAMRYRVIAPDLPGHGYSTRPYIFEYGINDHAECVARFMDALGIETAHLLGYSMGAAFALGFARIYPERVGKLILLSPGGITPEMPLFVRMMESGFLGGIASRFYGIKSVRRLIDESLFDHTVITEHDIEEYYRPASDPGGRSAIRRTVANFDEEGLLSSLREVKTEALIIWGTDDKLHPVESAENYASALRNSTLIKVLNSGHLIHEEKPDKLYSLIKKFIPAGYGDEDE